MNTNVKSEKDPIRVRIQIFVLLKSKRKSVSKSWSSEEIDSEYQSQCFFKVKSESKPFFQSKRVPEPESFFSEEG